MMIEICHIAPTEHILHAAAHSQRHMALAHLCDDPRYVEKFRIIDSEGGYTYLDNSQFELGTALPIDVLVKMASEIKAKCIILPDGEDDYAKRIKDIGYDVMYIPAKPDLEQDFMEHIYSPEIDYIGLSYSKTSHHLGRPRHSPTSRYDFLTGLGEILPAKKIHLLGAVVPGEIAMMKPYEYAIRSMDTSLAIWAGLNEINIKDMTHKNTESVNFNSDLKWNHLCDSNISYIKTLQNL